MVQKLTDDFAQEDLTDDPDNYKGISVSSSLSKLFSSLLYFRILEANDKFSLISNNQIGFLKAHRTADHVLWMDTIIHEIVHKHRKHLFVALICRLEKGILIELIETSWFIS